MPAAWTPAAGRPGPVTLLEEQNATREPDRQRVTKAEAHAATLASVVAYRTAMSEFAQLGTMEVWYAGLGEDEIMRAVRAAAAAAAGTARKAGPAGKDALSSRCPPGSGSPATTRRPR